MSVNHRMITIARESRGLTQAELADRLQIPTSSLSRIEFGSLSMRDVVFEKMCEELTYPSDFFSQSFSINPPNIHYRKRVTLSAKIIRKADALMNIYRANIEKMLKYITLETPNLPFIDENKYGSPRKIAAFLRSYWGVPKGAINDLVSLVEKHGVIVVMFDYETDKIDGRSMVAETGHPVIFLNKNFPGERQRLTLAHELGHIMMHLRTVPTFGRDEENEAFEFASEFLMPESEIKHELHPKLSIQTLADQKRVWKTSMAAILMWAEKLGRITPNHSRYIWATYSGLGYKRGEPIPITIDEPTLLTRIVSFFMEDKEYSKEETAKFFCLSEQEFAEKFISFQPRTLRLI